MYSKTSLGTDQLSGGPSLSPRGKRILLVVAGVVVAALVAVGVYIAVSGDQYGTDRSDSWFSVTNGMLLKLSHDINVHSPSPIGTVTYSERGSFVLTSLVPRR